MEKEIIVNKGIISVAWESDVANIQHLHCVFTFFLIDGGEVLFLVLRGRG